MNATELDVGTIVVHPNRPEWGPGKVLAGLAGGIVVVYFRDLPEEALGDAVKKISTRHVSLEVAPEQSDPFLDNLPPWTDKGFKGQKRPRLSFDAALKSFLDEFPRGFDDPGYIGVVGGKGERAYKMAAHDLWWASFGDGRIEDLLLNNKAEEIRQVLLSINGKVNLLSKFENMALRDGLADDRAVREFAEALHDVVDYQEPERVRFEKLIDAVERLPPGEKEHRVATWPILTQFPFLACPEHQMLLKPEVVQGCAARLNFDLKYETRLNWHTYEKLLEMSHLLLDRLKPMGARDLVDVQSFIFLIGEAE